MAVNVLASMQFTFASTQVLNAAEDARLWEIVEVDERRRQRESNRRVHHFRPFHVIESLSGSAVNTRLESSSSAFHHRASTLFQHGQQHQ